MKTGSTGAGQEPPGEAVQANSLLIIWALQAILIEKSLFIQRKWRALKDFKEGRASTRLYFRKMSL